MRYGMAIDLKLCVGCKTCSVACKMANNLPNYMWWLNVKTEGGDGSDTASGEYPGSLKMDFLPVNCQHCENPPCAAACPSGATYKREEDGIVVTDYEKCIGCSSCISACPYEGVRTLNEDEPEYYLDYNLGDATAPAHLPNVVEKCNFCVGRLEAGKKPACMELCISRARYFGDLDDPDSDVSKAIEGRDYMKLNEEAKTEPNIYYLI